MTLNIIALPAFTDNYIFHFTTPDGLSIIVDPGDADPVISHLEENNLSLDVILLTHHHNDHTGGVDALRAKYNCKIWGPSKEKNRIPDMDVLLRNEKHYELGDLSFQVFHTPGHTMGHICLYFEKEKVLFCGDTLFSLGCGRVFEGTMRQMFDSLQVIKGLPDDTQVYCAHEYTLSNAKFMISLDPYNRAYKKIRDKIIKKRDAGEITIPSKLGFEKDYNPFLTAINVNEFEERRKAKDSF